MTIDEIYEMWAKDGAIDQMNVSGEGANVPKLHNKYYKHYIEEVLRLKKLKADYKSLFKLKTEYYRGELDSDELKEYGWKPQPLKLLRADVPSYLEADPDIIKLSLKIGFQEEISKYLENIVKQINNRNFLLKTIIDFERFRSGA